MDLTPTMKKVLRDIDKRGYVTVHRYQSLSWRRREMLQKMADADLIKLHTPVIGSYLVYN